MADLLSQTLDRVHEIYKLLNTDEHLTYLNIDSASLNNPDELQFDRSGRLVSWKKLENAVKSIQDIGSELKGPSFVGFLGHFTSGKSSLINAVLGIKPGETPAYKRNTSEQPTDTKISLICHQDQYSSLSGNSFSSIDEIEYFPGPSDSFLDGVVLVDSPGIGNTDGEHQIADRFLHLCHVVVITIDGYVPLADTEKDFQLLDKAFNKLGNVPKIFVITKSVNFLKSRKGEFSTDWDGERADLFWEDTKKRMVSDGRFAEMKAVIDATPYVFVDSIDHYNIDAVKGEIQTFTSDESQRQRIYMAQVEYIKNAAVEAARVFAKYLSKRRGDLESLYNEAKKKAENSKAVLSHYIGATEKGLEGARGKLKEYDNRVRKINGTIVHSKFDPSNIGGMSEEYTFSLSLLRESTSQFRENIVNDLRQFLQVNSTKEFDFLCLKGKCPDFYVPKEKLIKDASIKVSDRDRDKFERLILNYIRSSIQKALNGVTADVSTIKDELFFNNLGEYFDATVKSISSSIGQFISVYNEAAKSFMTYIVQPSSKKLLGEYGCVLYSDDKDGELAIEYSTVTAEDFPKLQQLKVERDSVVEKLDQLKLEHENEIVAVEGQIVEMQEEYDRFEVSDSEALITRCWNSAVSAGLGVKIDTLDTQVKKCRADAYFKLNELSKSSVNDLRNLFFSFVEVSIRVVIVVGIFSALLFIAEKVAPSFVADVASKLTNNVGSLIVNLLAWAIGLVITFVIKGPRTQGMKDLFTLGFSIFRRWSNGRNEVLRALAESINDSVDSFRESVAATQLSAAEVIEKTVAEKLHSEKVFELAKGVENKLIEIQNKRTQVYSSERANFDKKIIELKEEITKNVEEKRVSSIETNMSKIESTKAKITSLEMTLNEKSNALH